MTITYFTRNRNSGFSIRKVFEPIITKISTEHQVTVFEIPNYRADPISILKNLWFVFRHCNHKGINHITGDLHYCILALIGCKSVLTIHDLGFIHNPLDKKGKIYTWYRMMLWVYIPALIASKITCISDKTAEVLMSYIPNYLHKKISIIYNPVDPMFTYSPKKSLNSKPIILHLGTKSNKNLKRIIVALKDINCILHIIGELKENQKSLLKNNHIEFNNEMNLTNEELVARYINCDIVSFPSLYEGFGMPIIEAQAVGRAVITSNIQPMIDVAANGACLVDPYSVNSLNEGFKKIIENKEYRESLIDNGLINIDRFRPEKIAQEYIEIYNQVLAK